MKTKHNISKLIRYSKSKATSKIYINLHLKIPNQQPNFRKNKLNPKASGRKER